MDMQRLPTSNPLPKKLWFRAKRYGWGWYPCSWEGWAILVLYVSGIFASVFLIDLTSPNAHLAFGIFFIHIVVLTSFLILICSATGEAPRWSWGKKKELMIDILDEKGARTGKSASRSEIHEKGLWHRAAHVYIINSKGEILLQRRAAQNSFRAGRWYLSTGAHVEAGKTSLETAKKAALDELGLRLSDKDFLPVGTISKQNVLLYGTYINNEFDDIYLVRTDASVAKLTKHTGEIGDIEWFPVEKFKEFITGNDPSFVQYEGLPVLFSYLDAHKTA